MRFSPSFLTMAIVAACMQISPANAQEVSPIEERMSARRDLEVAKIELRHYWQVEYPRQQRHLNAAIELTRAEICDLEFRLHEYRPFTRFSTGDPFMVTIQNTQMCLREAQLRLRDLWAERNALVRYHADEYRALELNVLAARRRVVELEPADEPRSARAAVDPSI
jgi:hypothetical protein